MFCSTRFLKKKKKRFELKFGTEESKLVPDDIVRCFTTYLHNSVPYMQERIGIVYRPN